MDNHEQFLKQQVTLHNNINKSQSFIEQLILVIDDITNRIDSHLYNSDETEIMKKNKTEMEMRLKSLYKLYNKTINDYYKTISVIEEIEKDTLYTSMKDQEKIDQLIQTTIPSLDPCMICNSYINIPVIPTCWKCANHPLPTCRIIICLQCFLHLVENSIDNYIQCPICRTHTVIHDLNEAFIINFEKMRILDNFIENNTNKKIVKCPKCHNIFDTLYDSWKHYVLFHQTF